MFHKMLVLSLAATLFLAACTAVGPAMPAADSDATMAEEGKMDEEKMDETMAEGEKMDDGMADMHPTSFTVRIENVSPTFDFSGSGVFNTPRGADAPGPLAPGSVYEFAFSAAPGFALSFATMFVQSNDLFYAPDSAGIALFNMDGAPISGDVTDQIGLWDAGTELNQEPGMGTDQAPRQSDANTGEAEEGLVQLVDDGYTYPAVGEHIQVTIEAVNDTDFVARIENISDDESLLLAPGVWVVHSQADALFGDGMVDAGQGLEALAEDGNPAPLAEALAARTGIGTPLAPGVWVVHEGATPLFVAGEADAALGLEALAEDGNPADLAAALADKMAMDEMSMLAAGGVFNTPAGTDGPGPLLPGHAYEFSVEALPGDNLSFATMFVQSNDLFYAPDEGGIALFDGDGHPLHGDVTDQILLWDAGTEVNQAPGIGADQAPRQAGPNTGADEGGVVQIVDDGFHYADGLIVVTISPEM